LNTVYENIFINIPEEIIHSDSYKDIKNEVLAIECTYMTEYQSEGNYILRVLCPSEHSSTIKMMFEIAIENEYNISKFNKDKDISLQKLEIVQKEVNKKRKFNVDQGLLGLIIGAKVYCILLRVRILAS
jgi:hypothetical protein